MMCNPYYEPEKLGLKTVDEIEYSSGHYEFDTRVIWTDGNGNFYTARDSGCSCPTPFEYYDSIESLDRLDYDALRAEVMGEVGGEWYKPVTMEIAQDFLKRVKDAMEGKQS